MEHMFKKIGSVLILCIGILLLLYGSYQKTESISQQEMIRVAVILPHKDDGYWSMIEQGVLKGEEEYRDRVDVKVYIPQLNYNVSQMSDLIKRQTAAKVDAIVVQGNEDKTYQKALMQAKKQGIQVVFVDTDVAEFATHLYVGTDNFAAGVLMGEKVAEVTGGKAKVAVLSGEEQYSNLQERYQGLITIAEEYPFIEFIRLDYDNYDGLTVISKYNQIHRENPEIDTLVCLEGTGGQTLGTVFNKRQDEYEHILCFDYTEWTKKALKNHIIDGVISQDMQQMGYRTIEEIVIYAETGNYSKYNIHTNLGWISAKDIEENIHE